MAKKEILSQSQIDNINNTITQLFSEKLLANKNNFFIALNREIDSILTQITMKNIENSKKKFKGIGIDNTQIKNQVASRTEQQALLAKGAMIIFKFREFLTGEHINYRYYVEITGKDGKKYLEAHEFTDTNILKYIKFGQTGLKMDQVTARNNSTSIDNLYSIQTTKYREKYLKNGETNYMKQAKNSKKQKTPFFVVRSVIMHNFYRYNTFLAKKNKNKNDNRLYQVFTQGHIIEAIDNAISYKQQYGLITPVESEFLITFRNQTAKINAIDNYVFSKYLAYDNIKASQGPDNSITGHSIKARNADFYDYYTIVEQLKKIKILLVAPFKPKEEIYNILKELFFHKSKFFDHTTLEHAAQEIINGLLPIDNTINELNASSKMGKAMDQAFKKLF